MKDLLSGKKSGLYIAGGVLLVTFILLAWISHAWLGTEIASQLFAAIAGAIIAAFITAILLRLQTQSQGEQEKESKVYEEKLRIYQEFLHKLNDIIRDNKIEKEEVIDLQFQVSYIDMHTSSEHIKEISEHVANIVKNINNPSEDFNLLEEMFAINETFREELYKKKETNIVDEKIKQNRTDAVDNFKSIAIYEQGNSKESIKAYERIKTLKPKIEAQGFRQWIWKDTCLVHELYIDIKDGTYIKSKNMIAVDFIPEGSDYLILVFNRQNKVEENRKLAEGIGLEFKPLENTIRHLYKRIPQSTSDDDIVRIMAELLKKLKAYRDTKFPLQ